MFPGSRAGTHVGFKLSRSTHLHEDTNGKLNIPNVRFVIYVQLISLTVIHPQERSSWISSSLKWRNNSPIVNCWRSWVPNLKLPVAHFLKFTIRRASVNRKVSPNEKNPIRYPSGFKSLIYVNVQILELIKSWAKFDGQPFFAGKLAEWSLQSVESAKNRRVVWCKPQNTSICRQSSVRPSHKVLSTNKTWHRSTMNLLKESATR